MSIRSKFEKWALRFKPYLIGYRNDFFEMYYLLNSPQEMIRRFKNMPFVKHNSQRQYITSQTPFVNLVTYYRECEEGLYVTYTEAEYKANIYFRCYADAQTPAEYYTLSLRTSSSDRNIHSLANGISYADDAWIIAKPGAKVNLHHFKGTKGNYISLYFKQAWIDQYLQSSDTIQSAAFRSFINSEQEYFICAQTVGKTFDINTLSDFFKGGKHTDPESHNRLYNELRQYVTFFEGKLQEEGLNERHFMISNAECLKVLQAKRMLESDPYAKFPGIPLLAKEAGFSETKLKACFRLVYGQTLLQYFHAKQMEEAKRLLMYTNLSIAAIARKLSYENPAKFTAAYKKHYNQLPSELKQQLHRIASEEFYQHQALDNPHRETIG